MMNRETLQQLDSARLRTVAELADDGAPLLETVRAAVTDAVNSGWETHLADASAELREAAAAVGPLDAGPGDDPATIRQQFVEAVRDRGASDEVVTEAVRAIDAYGFDGLVRDDLPLDLNAALRPDIDRGRILRLGAIDNLAAGKLNALVDRGAVSPDSIDEHVLGQAVADGDLTAREGD
jgi:hypothetical protein